MFDYEKSVGVEVIVAEYVVGYVVDVFELVRKKKKNEVERCLSR